MKLQLIKTKETDGDWYKVLVDGKCKGITNAKSDNALERATEIYDFLKENKGECQIIREEDIY